MDNMAVRLKELSRIRSRISKIGGELYLISGNATLDFEQRRKARKALHVVEDIYNDIMRGM